MNNCNLLYEELQSHMNENAIGKKHNCIENKQIEIAIAVIKNIIEKYPQILINEFERNPKVYIDGKTKKFTRLKSKERLNYYECDTKKFDIFIDIINKETGKRFFIYVSCKGINGRGGKQDESKGEIGNLKRLVEESGEKNVQVLFCLDGNAFDDLKDELDNGKTCFSCCCNPLKENFIEDILLKILNL